MSIDLVFEHDLYTGLPRLEDRTGLLSQDEVYNLQRELNKLFPKLVAPESAGQIVTFKTIPRKAARQYRVRVQPGPSPRYPTLLFESLNGTQTAPVPASPTSPLPPKFDQALAGWQQRFLDQVDELPAGFSLARSERIGLDFALEELHALGRLPPQEFATLLLSGFLVLADRVCRDRDPERGTLYWLAARALEPVCQAHFAAVDEAQLEHEPESSRTVPWLVKVLSKWFKLE